MSNSYVNKVIYDGNVLIDLTSDTITAADLAYGKIAHDKSGAEITGTNTKNIFGKLLCEELELVKNCIKEIMDTISGEAMNLIKYKKF